MNIETTRMGVAKLISVNIDFKTKAIKKAKQGHYIMTTRGFLSWLLCGKESTCQCRRQEFDSWSGKIPHVMGQLNPCATTMSLCSRAQELQLVSSRITNVEAHVPRAQACNKRSHHLRSLSTAAEINPACCN